jgi:hypothetical protein
MIAVERPRLDRTGLQLALPGLAAASTVAVTVVAVLAPGLLRTVLAVLVGALLVVTWLRWQRLGLLATMAFLPMLALVRRLLIPVGGFTSYDPLLLVVPAAAVVVLARLHVVERRPLVSSLMAKLVLALLLITVAEAFNPEGGSVSTGVTGLLFLAAPLAWFFIGREVADEWLISRLVVMVLVLATGIALYGLYQTGVGLPAWDQSWVAINGYAALHVGTAIRAFATFSSAQEYAVYLGLGLVVALTLVVKGHLVPLATVPVLGLALFIESGRGPLILTAASLVAVVGLSTGRPRVALLLAFVAVAGALLLERLAGAAVTQSAASSDNPFVAHQLGGLADPLNPDQSTLTSHVQLVVAGLAFSAQHPFGLGTALTTLAAGNVAYGQIASTEVDLANAFLSLGWIGGALFATIVARSLWGALRLGLRRRDLTALVCAGVLVATLGQWLNGGFYAVAPLIWLMVGWSSRAAGELRPARNRDGRRALAMRGAR